MADTATETQIRVARARSTAYGFLASALRYPDPAVLTALGDPKRWSSWPAVIREVDTEAAEHLLAVRDRLVSLSSDDVLQETYTRLFGHVVRGKCPLYELEYGRAEVIQQASELADIAGFYAAFGMELTDYGNERPDHAAVECEFMSVLAAKEAYAIDNDDPQAREVTLEAQRLFLSDHLGRWLPSFGRRLEDSDPDGFYGLIARFAAAFLDAECRHFDVECGPRFLDLRPANPSLDAAMTCGPEEARPQGRESPLVQLGIDSSPAGGK